MPSPMHSYRVFVRGTQGLEAEAQLVRSVIDAFNRERAVVNGVLFVAAGDGAPVANAAGETRAPAVIHEEVRTSDYFVLLLADRWRGEDDASGASVGPVGDDAEELYELAEECLHDGAAPMRQIAVYFRPPRPEQLITMDGGLRRVLEFKHQIDADGEHPHATFDSAEGLQDLVRERLAAWLRDDQDHVDRKAEAALARKQATEASSGSTFTYGVTPDETDATPGLVRAELVAEGKRLADAGRAAGAESCFSLAVARGDDPGAFIEYGKFLRRVGRLTQAQQLFEQALSFAQQRDDQEVMGAALSCLGMLLQLKGDLRGAEQMHRRGFEISKQRGDQRGLSQGYANLGLVHKARGNLAQAELMLRRALAIEEKLGRLHGMANQYCNLGLISRRLGDLARAEDMLRKALEIDHKLGRLEAMANGYGNIGLVLKASDDLEGAEDCFRRAMTINESLGRLEGLASDYGNLGLVCHKRGRLDEAEKMHLTSLSIEEQLGRIEGMARSHYSLGMLAQARLDGAAAREHWNQAKDLFLQIGMPREVRLMDRMLGGPTPGAGSKAKRRAGG